MTKTFLDLLTIARKNVRENPSIKSENTQSVTERYFQGLRDEVQEVKEEMRENNEIRLVDELSDIAWDYAVLLSVLEDRGYIPSVDAVIEHANEKYTERMPAFLQASQELWEEIKVRQKAELRRRHGEKYGE